MIHRRYPVNATAPVGMWGSQVPANQALFLKVKMEILTSNDKNVPTTSGWQQELKTAFRDLGSLLEFIGLPESALADLEAAPKTFPIRVPRPYAARIRKGDSRDPLLLQVVSGQGTPRGPAEWPADPVEDRTFQAVPGLLHKYHGRVLLILTGGCAIHCRYCFRQHFDYSTALQDDLEPALDYLRQDDSITEVILSGWDPLMKTDESLSRIVTAIESVGQVKRLRIHTRTPVVLPSRVTAELIDLLAGSRLQTWMVLHVNHRNELDAEVCDMLRRVGDAGLKLLNQAVLLRNVNDSYEDQRDLCEALLDCGVIPYYLHTLDRVKGAEAYEVDLTAAKEIMAKLKSGLPGYAIPRLVTEVAGQASKQDVW